MRRTQAEQDIPPIDSVTFSGDFIPGLADHFSDFFHINRAFFSKFGLPLFQVHPDIGYSFDSLKSLRNCLYTMFAGHPLDIYQSHHVPLPSSRISSQPYFLIINSLFPHSTSFFYVTAVLSVLSNISRRDERTWKELTVKRSTPISAPRDLDYDNDNRFAFASLTTT